MTPFDWKNSSVLVTGGTGSFGQKFVETMLNIYKPERIVVFSRDELKQDEMRRKFLRHNRSNSIRYFLGDVRDKERLMRAFYGIDVVIHAAALKQVPAAEYNPFEAVLTNIMGAKNVIDAAIDTNVKKVLALSTDKAVNPVNLYGATKLVSEKLFVQGNSYSSGQSARFSCVRYGNVLGSRGSVIPLFKEQSIEGKITITDKRMTRFWISLDQGVSFVIKCVENMMGGEVFIPKIPSMRVVELAQAIAPDAEWEITSTRPGEKINEVLVSKEESQNTLEFEDMFVVQPLFPWWNSGQLSEGSRLSFDFEYSSDTNNNWLSHDDLLTLLREE